MTTGSTRVTVHTEAFPAADAGSSRFQILVVEGPDSGAAMRLDDSPVIVGSDSKADLVLSDERVSGRHLELEAEGETIRVRDLESRNGTLFEGSLLSEANLRPGATLKIGRTFLRVLPEAARLDVEPSQRRRLGELVGESLAMREVFRVLELAADSDVTVLLEGETGTGKELAARAIHDASTRRDEPFVVVDCGSLPKSLLESELFGHVAGAFTGASGDRLGAFQRADGGTIFLDELGKIPPEAQSRLLRVCESRTVRPVGSDDARDVDVRIVGAGQELEKKVAEGDFRPDLFYRLSVVHVRLPPLRERLEDLSLLVRELLRRRGMDIDEVSGPNLDVLRSHRWPGNVRELRNVLERALALSPGAETFDDLRVTLSPVTGEDALSVRTDLSFTEAKRRVIDAFERRYLADLIERNHGNISAAAREADTDRKYLRKLLSRHDLI